MTYCVAIKTRAGLVFLSDSRTNAGLDQISTFRKMIIYEKPGDRFMTLLSAGNLSISQSVREVLQVEKLVEPGHDFGTVTDAINEAGIHKYLSKGWDLPRIRKEVRDAYRRHRVADARSPALPPLALNAR